MVQQTITTTEIQRFEDDCLLRIIPMMSLDGFGHDQIHPDSVCIYIYTQFIHVYIYIYPLDPHEYS